MKLYSIDNSVCLCHLKFSLRTLYQRISMCTIVCTIKEIFRSNICVYILNSNGLCAYVRISDIDINVNTNSIN